MTVLITGAGGFIGSHLVDSQVAQGRAVRAVDLDLRRLDHLDGRPGLERIAGDISDPVLWPRLVAGIEVVFHLASAHLDVTLPDDRYREINVVAAAGLARAAQGSGVARFIHVSTNGVVGRIDRPPVDETAVCRPENIYERTKLAGEEAVLQVGRESGLHAVVIRPAWVYGPRCPRTARLLRAIRRGRFVMFGSGRTLRHPIYVDDFVRGLELAAAAEAGRGEVYFLAGERPVTLNELAAAMAEAQGVRPPRLHLPLWFGRLAGRAAELVFVPLGRQPPISSRTLDFFTKDNAYRIDKAHRDFGFAPRIDLAEGLWRTLDARAEKLPESAPG